MRRSYSHLCYNFILLQIKFLVLLLRITYGENILNEIIYRLFSCFKGFIGSPGEAGQLGPEGERVSPFSPNSISKVIYL